MIQFPKTCEYDFLIEKIERKRKVLFVLSVIAILITILACSPVYIGLPNKTIVDYKGVNPIVTVLLILLVLFIEFIAYVFISIPLTTSMDIECNPQKYLTLNQALNKQKNKEHIYSVAFIYMGDFEGALYFSNKMIARSKPNVVATGLFNKARCEFFLGDFASLKETVSQYESTWHNMKKISQKTKASYEKTQKTLNLLVAISEENKNAISELRNIEAWNNSKATQGFINYLKGVSAYTLNDKEEAVYRLRSVKESCEKTVFSQLAEQYLSDLRKDN